MERKIGETFEFKGKTYKVVKFNGCANCAFKYNICHNLKHAIGYCIDFQRSDGAKVMFEEIKDNKLTIDIPEGMEIDLQNSNFDTGVICFKKKQPKFKDGDILYCTKKYGGSCNPEWDSTFIIKDGLDPTLTIRWIHYYAFLNSHGVFLRNAKNINISSCYNFRLATDSEKQKLFEALEKEGKSWDAEKKQIVDLSKKYEFKTFDKVICRDSSESTWEADFFSHYREDSYYPFACVGGSYILQCIPYEGNEHLLGTTDEWKGGEG